MVLKRQTDLKNIARRSVSCRPWRDASHVLLALAICTPGYAQTEWPQWGGPSRDFKTAAVELLREWPADGPPTHWRRELGPGNSAICVDGDALFTLYRRGEEEVVVALDAASGKTLWEYAYEAPIWPEFYKNFGVGPHATPIVDGGRVASVGVRGDLYCLDKKTGKKLWHRDLWREYGAQPLEVGYASSPVLYGKLLIVPVGGQGHGVMAFDAEDGSVVWAAQDFLNALSSPIVIEVGGEDQLVVFVRDLIAGLDPRDGRLLWQHPHSTQFHVNAMTPIWNGSDRLFLSSAYDSGSRALRLVQADGKTTVEELWFTQRVKIHHGTAVELDGTIYGSSGDFGPAFLVAVDLESGELTARQRGFAKTTVLAAGRSLILLTEDGDLALATANPDQFEVHARASILSKPAWTVPSLVGTTLYVRDQAVAAAYDLSPRKKGEAPGKPGASAVSSN